MIGYVVFGDLYLLLFCILSLFCC